MIQTLGEKLEKDEKELIEADKKEQIKGVREMPVLFEEADGVWLNLQGKDRKRRHFPKAEMKAAIAYDGWAEEGSGRYRLDGKVVTAGFNKASDFQKIREAMIASEYNLDVSEFKYGVGEDDKKGKLYLSVILDLCDRRPVAFVYSTRNDTKYVSRGKMYR